MNQKKMDSLRQSLNASMESLRRTALCTDVQTQLFAASETIKKAYLAGGALFVAGNGGSAADAQHLCAELVAKLCRDRSPIKAFAMSVDTSLLTAIGNDYGYEHLFSRQVEGLMSSKDVFLGITTSGNSKNILHALAKCRELGIASILLTGAAGGKARELATQLIQIPSEETRHVQEGHLMIYHTLCELIESDLVDAGICQYRSAGRLPPA